MNSVKNVYNKTVYYKLSTPNIMARKLEEDPLPFCKTEAKSEGFNEPSPIVGNLTCFCTFKNKQTNKSIQGNH